MAASRQATTAREPYPGLNALFAGTRMSARRVTVLVGNTQTSEIHTTIMEPESEICLAATVAMDEAKEVACVNIANEFLLLAIGFYGRLLIVLEVAHDTNFSVSKL